MIILNLSLLLVIAGIPAILVTMELIPISILLIIILLKCFRFLKQIVLLCDN